MYSAKVVKKSIAFRWRTDITYVRDWTGDFARGLWAHPSDSGYLVQNHLTFSVTRCRVSPVKGRVELCGTGRLISLFSIRFEDTAIGGTDVRASSRLEEVQSLRYRNGFGAPAHAQLTIDTADLGLNRVGGNDQGFCYLDIGAPSDQ